VSNPSQQTIRFSAGGKDASVTAVTYGAQAEPVGATVILGHGAGADQRSAFMTGFALALADSGIDVVTFNFLYTEQRRKAPDRAPVLEACYRAVIEAVLADAATTKRELFIGGKSMGGRIATQVAAADPQLQIAGLVLLGYPLHPPGRPAERRDRHLPAIRRPMLVVQGSRDAFGNQEEMSGVLEPLGSEVTLHVVANGDHSFKVPGGSKVQVEIIAGVQQVAAAWITAVAKRRREDGR